jgi:hypothetical protein
MVCAGQSKANLVGLAAFQQVAREKTFEITNEVLERECKGANSPLKSDEGGVLGAGRILILDEN